jgi:hypothetical protein
MDASDRASLELAQDDVVFAIDRDVAARRSSDFAVKLHRETGMLFVHGTSADLALVRDVVAGHPIAAGARESAR